jgi:hypothetical protein
MLIAHRAVLTKLVKLAKVAALRKSKAVLDRLLPAPDRRAIVRSDMPCCLRTCARRCGDHRSGFSREGRNLAVGMDQRALHRRSSPQRSARVTGRIPRVKTRE